MRIPEFCCEGLVLNNFILAMTCISTKIQIEQYHCVALYLKYFLRVSGSVDLFVVANLLLSGTDFEESNINFLVWRFNSNNIIVLLSI